MEAKYSDVIFDNSKRKPGHYGPKTDVAFSPAQIKAFKQNGYVIKHLENILYFCICYILFLFYWIIFIF